jgi:hypothetical protein
MKNDQRYHKCIGVTHDAHESAKKLAELLSQKNGIKVSIASATKYAVEQEVLRQTQSSK